MPSVDAPRRTTSTAPWALFTLAMVSIALHLWLGLASSHSTWMTVFMVAMAAACLPCTVNLLRSCSPKGLLTMMGLAAVSAAVHGALLVSRVHGSSPAGAHGTHHGHANASAGAVSGHGVELVVLVVVELGVLIHTYDLYSRRVSREPAFAGIAAPAGTRPNATLPAWAPASTVPKGLSCRRDPGMCRPTLHFPDSGPLLLCELST